MTPRKLLKQLGHNLFVARGRAGLTQEQLAKLVKISRVAITNLELGIDWCSVYRLSAIAGALGVPVSKLLPTFKPVVRKRKAKL